MKVKIGPYLSWVGPYQLADLLQYVGVSKDTCHTIGSKLPNWVTTVCQWIYDKRKRKIDVKIHRYDVWSMDSTLAYIIVPMLKKLKETKHGCPYFPVMNQTSNSAQSCFGFYEEGDTLAWESGFKEWNEILGKMIWAFEQVNLDWEEQYTIVQPEIDFTEYPEDVGKEVVPLRWKVEGITDWDGRKNHSDKMQEGFELFGKYYQSLWD